MKAATIDDVKLGAWKHISIHAAREGGDHTPTFKRCIIMKFQSTPPVKAATHPKPYNESRRQISIHAAREGGDTQQQTAPKEIQDFNPRRP